VSERRAGLERVIAGAEPALVAKADIVEGIERPRPSRSRRGSGDGMSGLSLVARDWNGRQFAGPFPAFRRAPVNSWSPAHGNLWQPIRFLIPAFLARRGIIRHVSTGSTRLLVSPLRVLHSSSAPAWRSASFDSRRRCGVVGASRRPPPVRLQTRWNRPSQ